MAPRVIPLERQIRAMASVWPSFKPTPGLSPFSVVWFGDLPGLERTFHVTVELAFPGARQPGGASMPVVRVLRPCLRLNWDAEDEAPLPHVYFDQEEPTLSPLCLFDPRRGEWHHGMLIANTIVPWARRWLFNYELWEATGRWYGGGTHVNLQEAEGA